MTLVFRRNARIKLIEEGIDCRIAGFWRFHRLAPSPSTPSRPAARAKAVRAKIAAHLLANASKGISARSFSARHAELPPSFDSRANTFPSQRSPRFLNLADRLRAQSR